MIVDDSFRIKNSNLISKEIDDFANRMTKHPHRAWSTIQIEQHHAQSSNLITIYEPRYRVSSIIMKWKSEKPEFKRPMVHKSYVTRPHQERSPIAYQSPIFFVSTLAFFCSSESEGIWCCINKWLFALRFFQLSQFFYCSLAEINFRAFGKQTEVSFMMCRNYERRINLISQHSRRSFQKWREKIDRACW